MGVAPDLESQPRRKAGVALAQIDTCLFRQTHKPCARPLVEPRICRMRDGLFHDRRVDRYPLQALLANRARGLSGLDDLGQQPEVDPGA